MFGESDEGFNALPEDMERMAFSLGDMYRALIKADFPEERAFQLVMTALATGLQQQGE